MKKLLFAFACLLQCSTMVNAQTNPYVGNPDISPNPIPITNPDALFTFDVGNTGQTLIPYNNGDEIIIKITLSNGTPKNTTTPVASLGGTWLSYFNWSYNSGTKTYTGVQNKDIPATDVFNPAQGTITVNYHMVTTSTQANAQNGFSVNLTPNGGSAGNTTSDDHAEIFTYTVSSPLPVTLTNFGGNINGCNAILNWSTGSEQNFDRFDVQYSRDGKSFSTIGQVQSKGKAAGSAYSFTYSPESGKGYYRLSIVDKDGSSTASKVIDLTARCSERSITLAPNPTTSLVRITGLSTGDQIRVYGLNGQLVLQQTAANLSEQIDLGAYPAGMYQVIIANSTEQLKAERIMKQ